MKLKVIGILVVGLAAGSLMSVASGQAMGVIGSVWPHLVHLRSWESRDGKVIEADLVKVEGETVVLSKKGKIYRVPLSRLSEQDQEFVADYLENQGEEVGDANQLFGTSLIPGKRVEASKPLSEDLKGALSGKHPHSEMKIAVHLPQNFSPDQPQKVFWPVAGLNNQAEWKSGNIGKMNWSAATATENGYLVIAADTDQGNPLNLDASNEDVDYLFHKEVVAELEKIWPEFRNWQHVCGGFSGGAKSAYYRIAQLRGCKVNVVGAYIGGCNRSYAEKAQAATKTRKSHVKQVKAWISAGEKDSLVSEQQIEQVEKDTKSAGYRKTKLVRYPGGHVTDMNDFAQALSWFVEE